MHRDGGVGFDELGHHAAEGLDTQRKRGDVQKEDILNIACEHAALDGCADCNDLIRIDALVGLLAEEVLHQLLNLGDTGGAANEQDFVDIGSAQMSILQGLAARLDAALEEVVAEGLELGAGKALHKVTGHTVHCSDIRQVDLGARLVRKLYLGLFGSLLEALERHRILLEVQTTVFRCELGCEPVDDYLVEIVAAEVGVTVGGLDFENTVAELQDGDIEGAAAEVVDRDLHILVLLVQTVCKGCCGRFVDDTLHIQACNLAGLLGGLALTVGEVCRNGDNRLCDRLTEVVLSSLLHLLEDDGADLLRRIHAAVDIYAGRVVFALHYAVGNARDFAAYLVVGFTHEALDAEYRIFRIGDGLTLGGVTHLTLAVVGECDHRRGGALAFVIDDNGRLVAFHDRHATVRGSKVDSNDFSHNICLFYLLSVILSPGGDAFLHNESCATGCFLTKCHYLCLAMDYEELASRIVYEDNHLLVIDKKVGEIVQGDKTGDTPLSDILKAYIKERDNKPGNVFLGVPHRLDRPVCGLCIFAKTSKALERLNAMFRDGEVHKTYLALCCAAPAEPEGLLEDWMERNERLNKSFITRKPGPKAKLARLRYRHIADTDRYHLLEVELLTGRHHQIRCQLSHMGCCIKGDLKYGAPRSNPDGGICLQAHSISFLHPVKKEQLHLVAAIPQSWKLPAGVSEV